MTGRRTPETRLREISDAQTLRALTHPTRIALIEALSIQGPMTATEAAEWVGESPSSCSFHLRQLEKYGFVEEAGRGAGRRRPWKVISPGLSMETVQDDPRAEIATSALIRLLHGRQMRRFETWLESETRYSRDWRSAAINDQNVFWMSAAELEELGRQLREMLLPLMRERLTDASTRPQDALPVEVLVFGYPIGPPKDTVTR